MISRLLRIVRRLGTVPAAIRMVRDPVLSRPYFPEQSRKSTARMLLDNVGWVLRYGEADPFYFALGLDRADAIPMRLALSRAEVKRRRDHRNRSPETGLSYRCIMADKQLFGYLAAHLGYPHPRLIALLSPDGVRWQHGDRSTVEPLTTIAERELDVFCKPALGTHGEGAFTLCAQGGQLRIDGAAADVQQLRLRLGDRHLMQERLCQHPALAALHPASVNTLRLVTVREPDGLQLLFAGLRMGVQGSCVDNWGVGGIFVGVDVAAGTLRGLGLHKPGMGTRVTHHPDTGIALDGYPIPFMREAVDMALRFHRDLPVLHSIGWDLAITPEGPAFVEGNDDWGGRIVLALDPECRERSPALYGPPRAEP